MDPIADHDALRQDASPEKAPVEDAIADSMPNGTANLDKEAEATSFVQADPKLPTLEATTPGAAPSDTTLASRTLHFLSTATPQTLTALGVGFAAITYAILGKLGLLFIGAFAGAVGFIALEARYPDIARAVRGEKGPDILDRTWLELQDSRLSAKESNDQDADEDALIKSFDDFRPETREALGGLIDAIIRDHVKWWYSPIIPTDHSFPLACRRTITSYILSISNRMFRKRPADSFLDLLTNSSSIVIAFMSELGAAFADLPPDSSMTAVDAVYNYLASNPDSRLAHLLDQRQQSAKFKMVAEELLGFLDQNSYNCDTARVFLREIMANAVLETTLQSCSKAEWINGWIVYLLEAGEPDLNQAIDVGMQTGRDATNNVFADLDGNVGNISIAKPGRIGVEGERGRRKESAHRKKLSKADEEMEEAMEEMKRMNAMMSQNTRRPRDSATIDPSERSANSLDLALSDVNSHKKATTPGNASPTSGPSADTFSPPGTSTDSVSAKSEAEQTPITPRSTVGSSSQNSSPKRASKQFTNFDQIVPNRPEDVPEEDVPKKAPPPLTLHNASFTLHDDAANDKDKGKIRNKPSWDYLIQVEPSSSDYPGWMIVRRYSDFATLHEILRRIANVSGATAFTELHKELPNWKLHSRESLRGELERYLRDACWYQSLAESEGMKRFLEKSQGHTHTDAKTFGWETVGKNMLDVLTIAPKGAMESGKSLVGNVTGVFGNIPGLGRKNTNQSVDLTPNPNRLSLSAPPRADSMRSPARSERASMDSQRSSVISTQPGKMPPMERRPSFQSQGDGESDFGRIGRTERMDSMSASISARPSREHSRASSLAPMRSGSTASLDFMNMKLPPPPDEMDDDYDLYTHPEDGQPNEGAANGYQKQRLRTQSLDRSPAPLSGTRKGTVKPSKQYSQLSETETRVAVELLFAVINEMYTLSSAWNIRRTLLTAAKSFLLRPGNPSLLTVQSLIQSSVLDANTSDSGISAQLRKLRETAMPTDEERAAWPAEMTPEEKEKLATKARRLLIRSGVPAALMGVMGQAATGEALGRVFDCLQIEEVARGLIFGLMLQAVRVLTH